MLGPLILRPLVILAAGLCFQLFPAVTAAHTATTRGSPACLANEAVPYMAQPFASSSSNHATDAVEQTFLYLYSHQTRSVSMKMPWHIAVVSDQTKNRSREDINAEFGDRVAVHYFGATEEGQLEYAKAIDGGEGTLANVTRGGEKDDEVQQIDIVKKG
ncbi:hypothetical protein CERZMDRAFT_96158 [Cercospora zeae-maydis SCOH1-5]|uniref:Inhibitor I9 domain-containing protein n=1 Tax=Cercospora zeae-maydis SCOH1-5 TaxID=717836 RepID=A0A6A6FL11_9PEZI|nr:hypothetical protein CERZMDRAFT_96158 [Cercospora zeae-maydis SCOH1-5]